MSIGRNFVIFLVEVIAISLLLGVPSAAYLQYHHGKAQEGVLQLAEDILNLPPKVTKTDTSASTDPYAEEEWRVPNSGELIIEPVTFNYNEGLGNFLGFWIVEGHDRIVEYNFELRDKKEAYLSVGISAPLSVIKDRRLRDMESWAITEAEWGGERHERRFQGQPDGLIKAEVYGFDGSTFSNLNLTFDRQGLPYGINKHMGALGKAATFSGYTLALYGGNFEIFQGLLIWLFIPLVLAAIVAALFIRVLRVTSLPWKQLIFVFVGTLAILANYFIPILTFFLPCFLFGRCPFS